MRLIDADELIEEIDYYTKEAGWGNGINKICHWCKEFINNQPTAYDVDKVVERLEESYSCDIGALKMITLETAVDIVKGGGANE